MRTDYLAELDPQEKARLETELLEVIEKELNKLAQDNPAAFDSLLKRLELVRQKRLAQANKDQPPF